MNRPLPALVLTLLALGATGCGFTGEPDPGGFANLEDGGLPAPAVDASRQDARAEPDAFEAAVDMALPPPPDAQFDDDARPPDAGLFDAGLFDAGPFDGGLFDGGPLDGAVDGGAEADAAPDMADPDGGLPTPEDHCDVACTELVACGPGPEPDECRRECLAEDDEQPGTAARLEDCVRAHVSDGRCDIAALQVCMADEPLPQDPHCVLACDALGACPDLPARPDCVETCTEEPGPERQRLHRCVEAHVAEGRCDGIGFLLCGDQPPEPADTCRFVCIAESDCEGNDGPLEPCIADCVDQDANPRAARARCAGQHLDRGRCALDAYAACLEQ